MAEAEMNCLLPLGDENWLEAASLPCSGALSSVG